MFVNNVTAKRNQYDTDKHNQKMAYQSSSKYRIYAIRSCLIMNVYNRGSGSRYSSVTVMLVYD